MSARVAAARVATVLALLLGQPALSATAQPAPGAAAQPAPDAAPTPGHAAAPGVADVPPGPATIRGRVVHAGRPEAVAGVEVVLYALPPSGVPGVRRAVASDDGSFVFEGISNDPSTAYLVGARYGEIPFPGQRVSFETGETERSVEVPIAESTRDPAAASVGAVRMRIDRVGGRLLVTETHQLRNAGAQVIFVPPAEQATAEAPFRTALPKGAGPLTGPLGIVPEGLVRGEDEVAFWGPLYPGEQELAFGYALPATTEGETALLKRFPEGGESFALYVSQPGPEVEAPTLRAGEPVTQEGRTYRPFEGDALRPGEELAVTLTLPPTQTDPSTLSLLEKRAFLEQDAALLTVREQHRLRVDADRPLAAPEGQSLYGVTLPEGASDVRFATEPQGIALVPDDEGGIAVAGPLPPGEAVIEILYDLPVEGGESRLALQSSLHAPLLSLYVADTGLALSSDRLHRRRPVRTEDRTYLHLEAFEVEPGERVTLALEALSRPAAPGRGAVLAMVAIAAAALAWVLAAPLRRRGTDAAAIAGDETAPAARRERDALYAAIRDLEDDFETGKLSEEDHALLREELRLRALALAQSERDTVRKPATKPLEGTVPAGNTCGRCQAALRSEDRFCSQCGAPAAVRTEREASA